MAVRETILRYNLIIQKLRKHPASLEEIQSYLAHIPIFVSDKTV